jgi:hypothetical protein
MVTAHHDAEWLDGCLIALQDPEEFLVRAGPRESGIGVVVDHDDLGTTQVELFHGAQPDILEAAHAHVTLHAVGLDAIHPSCCRPGSPRKLLQR